MTRDMTLSEALFGTDGLGRKLAMVVLGTAFIAVAAKISVPMVPVPMTLQTLAILIVGFAYGSRLGAITLIAYLAEGLAGLPVFSTTTPAGPAAFMGPTAGFLIGFVGMAWAAGWAAERGIAKGFFGTALSALVITTLLYVPGIAWPMTVASVFGLEAGWAGQGLGFYWQHFMSAFVIGDAIKAVIAGLVVTAAWAQLKRN